MVHTLQSTDISLRPITISDAEGFLRCHQDKDAKNAFSRIPASVKEARSELQAMIKDMRRTNPENEMFAIVKNGQFTGFIKLKQNNNPQYKHSAVVGYGIMQGFRRQGIATTALKLVTSYGFKKCGLKRITATCRTFNKPSRRVLEKAGYKMEGILKKNKFQNGRYLDDMLWAKVK